MSDIIEGLVPKWLIIHHAGGTDADPMADASNYSLAQCNADHKTRFKMLSSLGSYVGYHYFIDKKGVVTQTRQDNEEGCHCTGYNNHRGDNPSKSALGICMTGNFDAYMPTDAQRKALKALLEQKMAQYSIPASRIVPHRTFAHKSCYGEKLSDTWAQTLVKPAPAPQIIKTAELGQTDANVELIQKLLIKAGYVIKPFTGKTYDTNMAQAVLYFQLKNNVAEIKELAELRGEKVGPKTVKALQNIPIA